LLDNTPWGYYCQVDGRQADRRPASGCAERDRARGRRDSRPARDGDREELPSRRNGKLGYCPQTPLLWGKLTIDEHFELFARAYALEPGAAGSAAESLLAELQFEHEPDVFVADNLLAGLIYGAIGAWRERRSAAWAAPT
jgi:hypothetical protein